MNISVKFQLHPPYGFWGDDFLIFVRKFNILVAMATNPLNQSNSAVWKKFIYMLGRGLLKEHFCKTFIKYICSETTINANFHISHYMSMSNYSSYPIGTKKKIILFVPRPIDAIYEIW